MKRILSFLLISAIFCLAHVSFAQQKWPGVVLYSIERNSITHNLIIDPAVRIAGGEFSYPVPTPAEAFEGANSHKVLEGYFDRFNKEEYPEGRNLDLYINGNKCGTVTVTHLDSLNSCSPVVSEVTVSCDDTSGGCFADHGIAIVSAKPLNRIPRIMVDSIKEASILDYGKKEFIRRGVKKETANSAFVFEIRGT